jgi:septum formation protein
MRKVTLASASPARRRLLEQIGLAFSVARSSVRESRTIRTNCEDLVMGNALRKARDIASRLKARSGRDRDPGIVVGADTVVLVGRRIIGKPKSIRDAKRTLKLLSQRPQWVYSGIAVVDARSGMELVGHERTKIYMYPITDRQIEAYFRRVSPLDKAGSFDIQGLGGIFIDRIEGCFYNVVGLPLAKLSRMLGKMGVGVF